MTPAATLTVAPPAVDPFVRELDELAARAGSLPPAVVAALRSVLETLIADELEPPERDCALRMLAQLR